MAANQSHPIHSEPLPEGNELEADNDSTYQSVSGESETTTLKSDVIRGCVEHGRRYQTLREGRGQYYVPADEKQFESIKAGHLAFIILESQRENPLFRSPINEATVQNILDLGTCNGAWAIDVADRYPQATQEWVPPNCILEVDDITRDFTYKTKFDLIHIRQLLGSFSFEEWDKLDERVYDALEPGGWIEQAEQCDLIECEDGSAPGDAPVLNHWRVNRPMAEASGNPVTVYDEMRERIEKARFVNVHDEVRKMPLGDWPKHPIYKDVGKCNRGHCYNGLEGWSLWLLTKFAKPEPYTVEEAHAYIAKLKADVINPQYHLFQKMRRVYAQKPYANAQ